MKRFFLFLTILIFAISGCKKIDKLTQFEMEFESKIVFPAGAGVNLPFNLFTPEIETNSSATFESNDTRKDLIEEIVLTQMDFTLTSPSTSDLGFLNEINIFISAEGLEEKNIAWKHNISSNVGKYLDLEVSGDDIQPYLKKDEFFLRVNTITDEVISDDHHIDIGTTFFVDAKILGQ